LGQITKAPVHERMLIDGAILVLPVVLVCGDNGSNFSACF